MGLDIAVGRERILGRDRGVGVPNDFISIPAGIPHWVSAIEGKESVYLVVKTKEGPHAR